MNTSLLLGDIALSRGSSAALLLGCVINGIRALGEESTSLQDADNTLVGLNSDVVLIRAGGVNRPQEDSPGVLLNFLWCGGRRFARSLLGHGASQSLRSLARLP